MSQYLVTSSINRVNNHVIFTFSPICQGKCDIYCIWIILSYVTLVILSCDCFLYGAPPNIPIFITEVMFVRFASNCIDCASQLLESLAWTIRFTVLLTPYLLFQSFPLGKDIQATNGLISSHVLVSSIIPLSVFASNTNSYIPALFVVPL